MGKAVGDDVIVLDVALFKSKEDPRKDVKINVPSGACVADVKREVSRVAAPLCCAALLLAGRKLEDSAKAMSLAGSRLVAFLRTAKKKMAPAGTAADAGEKNAIQAPRRPELAEGEAMPSQPHPHQSPQFSSSSRSTLTAQMTNSSAAAGCAAGSAAGGAHHDGEVETSPANRRASQKEDDDNNNEGRGGGGQGREGKKRGDKGEDRDGGGGGGDGDGDGDDDDDAVPPMSTDCQRILEGFRVLNQLFELYASNFMERVTVARAVAHGQLNGGALCMHTLRQMITLCPHLIHVSPAWEPHAGDVQQATLDLAAPPSDWMMGRGKEGGDAAGGKRQKRPMGGWSKAKNLRRQMWEAQQRMVEMRGALLDYMDQHHESHLVQSGQDQPESRWDLPGWCPTFDFEGVPPIAAADILAHAARARDAGDEGMGRMRCLGSEPINPEDFAAHVESLSPLNSNCCVYTHHVPAREAKLSTSGGESLGINPKVEGMLRANGLDPDGLYSHQASAIAASLSGRDTIVTTSTASGKSLCFNVPVLSSVTDPHGPYGSVTTARALYIYPTKALAQDQLRALHKLSSLWLPPEVAAVLDGDTPHSQRSAIMGGGSTRGSSIVLTNPDMLHCSVLPYHKRFVALLSSLSYVILDEAHMYHGAFGMHTGMVLRRLRRLCALYGSNPRFICCSATIGAAAEHVAQITGLEAQSLHVVSEDGSPRGEKLFVLWNPPVKPYRGKFWRYAGKKKQIEKEDGGSSRDKEASATGPDKRSAAEAAAAAAADGGRGDVVGKASLQQKEQEAGEDEDEDVPKRFSSISEVAYLLAELVRHDIRTIAFCTTRKLSELVLQYALESLSNSGHARLCGSIKSYRGGYTPEQRRSIEAELFGDILRGVAATNALELGVDVGSMDATLHLGFQRSVASLWQQAGRAGRRGGTSLSIYVAWDSPLDQWLLQQPERLFEMPLETNLINMANQHILQPHLLAAAFEMPLVRGSDSKLFGDEAFEIAVQKLTNEGDEELGSLMPVGMGGQGGAEEKWSFCGDMKKGPTPCVSLRCIDQHRWAIKCPTGPNGSMEVMEEVEEWMAFFQIYEGAVYMNNGKTYIVDRVDEVARHGLCRPPCKLDYYTAVRDKGEIHTQGGQVMFVPHAPGNKKLACAPHWGRATMVKHFLGYTKFQKITGKFLDSVDLVIPSVSYETYATWIALPNGVQSRVKERWQQIKRLPQGVVARNQCKQPPPEGTGEDEWELEKADIAFNDFFQCGMHGACHAIANALPLVGIKCSPSDCTTECQHPDARKLNFLRLIIADRCKGGNGLSQQAYSKWAQLIETALEVVSGCSCQTARGCPGCIYMLSCQSHNHMLDKESARIILTSMLESVEAEEDDVPVGKDDQDRTGEEAGDGPPKKGRRGKRVRGKEERQVMYNKVLRSQRTLY